MTSTKKTLILTAFLCLSLATAASPALVPIPKSLKAGDSEISFSYTWRISDNENAAAMWLSDELTHIGGFKIDQNASHAIEFSTLENATHSEEYILSIDKSGVILKAADEKGFLRAAGRLLAILHHPDRKYDSKAFTLPAITIQDWPDFPLRIADLTMSFWEPMTNAERLSSTKKLIEILAEHGYNAAVIHLGSNYQSDYFKSQRPTPWSKNDIRNLVKFCKERGVTPIPGFSTFSHASTAPQICLITNEKGDIIGQDVRKPEFMETYVKILDEMLELFDNPPYFRVGGDEAQDVLRFMNLTTAENARLFADTFNFIAEYLDKRNCRAVIWHDMLVSKQLGGSRPGDGFTESNITPATEAIAMLSKKLIINYWNYGKSERYEGVDVFREAGFDVWSSCWNILDGIPALANYSFKKGVTAYDATTWCLNHNKGGALLYAGECGWNANTTKQSCDYEELYLQEWNAQPWFEHPENATTIQFAGGIKSSDTEQREISLGNLRLAIDGGLAPQEIHYETITDYKTPLKLMRTQKGVDFYVDGNERYDMKIDHVNGARNYAEIVLYTPEWGPTTKQNKWGEEWSLANGRKVIDHYRTQENSPIPPDGLLISVNVTGADKHNNIRRLLKHGEIKLIAAYPEKGKGNTLSATLKSTTKQIILVFASKLWPFSENPSEAVSISIKNNGGDSMDHISLFNDFALAPDPHFTGNFQKFYLQRGFMAIVWNANDKNTIPEKIELKFSEIGLTMGLRLVGAMEL